jgi:hypothetical protein
LHLCIDSVQVPRRGEIQTWSYIPFISSNGRVGDAEQDVLFLKPYVLEYERMFEEVRDYVEVLSRVVDSVANYFEIS